MTEESHGIDRLLRAIQELTLATSLQEVQAGVRTAARDLAACDGATFVLRDGDQCFYADEDAIEPLWKGQRFPLESCISGWVILNREHVAIRDIYADPRVPHDAYRPTFIRSLLMVPVRSIEPIGAIGAYWAVEHTPTDLQVSLLQGLANATSAALDKLEVQAQLRSAVQQHHEARALSATDELTGLWNRRGLLARAAEVWRDGSSGALALLDMDGLKTVNDTQGHHAGDELIRSFAETLTRSVRSDDVVARVGGDEFVVLCPAMDADALRTRLASRVGHLASIGAAEVVDPEHIHDAVLVADAAMYDEKRLRAAPRLA